MKTERTEREVNHNLVLAEMLGDITVGIWEKGAWFTLYPYS